MSFGKIFDPTTTPLDDNLKLRIVSGHLYQEYRQKQNWFFRLITYLLGDYDQNKILHRIEQIAKETMGNKDLNGLKQLRITYVTLVNRAKKSNENRRSFSPCYRIFKKQIPLASHEKLLEEIALFLPKEGGNKELDSFPVIDPSSSKSSKESFKNEDRTQALLSKLDKGGLSQAEQTELNGRLENPEETESDEALARKLQAQFDKELILSPQKERKHSKKSEKEKRKESPKKSTPQEPPQSNAEKREVEQKAKAVEEAKIKWGVFFDPANPANSPVNDLTPIQDHKAFKEKLCPMTPQQFLKEMDRIGTERLERLALTDANRDVIGAQLLRDIWKEKQLPEFFKSFFEKMGSPKVSDFIKNNITSPEAFKKHYLEDQYLETKKQAKEVVFAEGKKLFGIFYDDILGPEDLEELFMDSEAKTDLVVNLSALINELIKKEAFKDLKTIHEEYKNSDKELETIQQEITRLTNEKKSTNDLKEVEKQLEEKRREKKNLQKKISPYTSGEAVKRFFKELGLGDVSIDKLTIGKLIEMGLKTKDLFQEHLEKDPNKTISAINKALGREAEEEDESDSFSDD